MVRALRVKFLRPSQSLQLVLEHSAGFLLPRPAVMVPVLHSVPRGQLSQVVQVPLPLTVQDFLPPELHRRYPLPVPSSLVVQGYFRLVPLKPTELSLSFHPVGIPLYCHR